MWRGHLSIGVKCSVIHWTPTEFLRILNQQKHCHLGPERIERMEWKKALVPPKVQRLESLIKLFSHKRATFHEKKRMTRRVEPWAQSAELHHWSTGIETSLPSWLLIMLRISDLFFLSIFSHFEWPYLQIFLFLSHHIVLKQIACLLVSWVHRWKGNLLQDEL